MQTLKTAAIVVLLMTVMYGAYVSFTTPPEPLPADVENMLVINDEGNLAIDAGLPESLGELEINAGTAANGQPNIQSPDASGAMDVASLDPMTANATAVDAIAASMIDSRESGVTTTLSDETPRSANVSTSAAAERAYPSTTTTFELPDPRSIESSFDPSGHSKPDLPQTNLALTSGMSDTQAAGVAPDNSAVSPISATDLTTGAQNLGLANAIRTADIQFAEDKRKDALATLSIFYNTPNLSGEQRSELLARLDPLAREVIYSQRHLIEQPHRVGQNETLMEIAARYEVPWQLLANINQIQDPVTVLPGTELKVVRGPFRAEINLAMKELTLFLGDLYAGRFPIGIGSDPAPKPGTFTVQDKQTGKTYYDISGSPIPSGSPNNPYGDVWLDLGGQLCIHGSPSTTSPTDKGCISLAADYADDLYGILSQGSSVTIRR